MKYLDIENIRQRKVGPESSRSFIQKLKNGFWDRYCQGQGMEIGPFGNQLDKGQVVSILPTAIGVDIDYPGYDGIHLPFENERMDFLYSSHVLEHVQDRCAILKEWHRVLKVNGYMIICVPHAWLYEKKLSPPSRWNEDHKVFFTPASLLKEIEESLESNSYRIRYLQDDDECYDYSILPDKHSAGEYSITIVIEKISLPSWKPE